MAQILHTSITGKTLVTRYKANRAFGGLLKFSSYLKYRQIADLAFKMSRIKTKYNALAQCKFEGLSLSSALLAIHKPLSEFLRPILLPYN